MTVKINKLEIENIKRVKAVQVEPTHDGLTVIGGRNNQGKTSVLDSITWVLGGDRYRPSQTQREGSVVPPYLKIELSNGIIVERKGKNSDLKVIDSTGNKAGQQLLNEFVEQLALDLPKFMQANNKEKADTLLQIIGVGPQLYELECKEKELYNQRLTIGQIADQKKKFAAEMTVYPEVPKELVSASELIKQQQEILAKNGENQRKRQNVHSISATVKTLEEEVTRLQLMLDQKQEDLKTARTNLSISMKSAEDLLDESTEELERNIADIDEINRKVRANMDREKAEIDAQDYQTKYDTLTEQIQDVRHSKTQLLNAAQLPLPELSVEEGELTYRGFKWDNLSGSDQLKVAVAIVRKLNPGCGFVLIDKLEQMDVETMREFGLWLEQENLQAIATRVSSGDECSIIIEDGYSAPAVTDDVSIAPVWKEGEF